MRGPDSTIYIGLKEKTSQRLTCVLLICIAVVTVGLRCVRLSERPMHHDEANQAVRCLDMLEGTPYHYDASDHHGPTLYAIALPLLRVCKSLSSATEQDTAKGMVLSPPPTESSFRLLPVLFSGLLIMSLTALTGTLPPFALASAALLAAVSPMCTYYSRYFIQETLLVYFLAITAFKLWNTLRFRTLPHAIGAGLALGLAMATKETWTLWAAAFLPALLAFRWIGIPNGRLQESPSPQTDFSTTSTVPSWLRRQRPLLLLMLTVGGTALLCLIVIFTNGLSTWKGLLDFFRAFHLYAEKAVSDNPHRHSILFYWNRLLWFKAAPGPRWSEAIIYLFAIAGLATCLPHVRRPHGLSLPFTRLLAVHAVTHALLYSLLSYKTPWCALGFHYEFILLAGIGANMLFSLFPKRLWKGFMLFILFGGLWQLTQLNRLTNTRFCADPRNPWAYVHTLRDILNLQKRIQNLALNATPSILVCTSAENAWPMPWYLRCFPKTIYTESCPNPPTSLPDFIITAPETEENVAAWADSLYDAEFFGLRPNCLLMLRYKKETPQTTP